MERTNNHAERLLRRGVLWRKHAFGSPSKVGRFVERLLTVAQTCRLQGRSVLHYLYEALLDHRVAFVRPHCFPPSERLPEGNCMRELERSRLKRATGLPPQYVILRRAEGTRHLLQARTELSLAEVAAHTGFSDQSQFTHHFKRIVGATPGQFRTSARTA